MTIVDQVKNWYRENVQRFGESLSKVNINSNTADPVRGAVVIEMETRALVASITFWNKGDVCVLGLHKQTKEDMIFDDRTLNPSEDIPTLLDRYFQEIAWQR